MSVPYPYNQLAPGAVLRVLMHKEHSEHRLVGELVGHTPRQLHIVPIAEWRHGKPVP